MNLEDKIYNDLIERKTNVFITGKSGAGKTYLTRKVISKLLTNDKKLGVGGSTGIAARNLHNSAKTVHSLLKLGIISDMEEYKIKRRNLDPELIELISSLDVLIIEEISMISANFLDVIMYHLKRCAFEGVILAVGDFSQIPPVVNFDEVDYDYYMAFKSKNWLFKSYVLNEVKRTTDSKFVEWSNHLRDQNYEALANNQEFLDFVNRTSVELDENYVKLFSTNNEAEIENEIQLAKIQETKKSYKGIFTLKDAARRMRNFDFLKEDNFYRDIRPLKNTVLAIGARVMTCVNHPSGAYVNGDIGTVVDFIYNSEEMMTLPVVKIDSTGDIITIKNHDFEFEELIDGEYQVIATIKQLPLKLAYAITIHKSQGLSLEKLYIDCSKFFLPSQLYVAWTRASNPENFVIENLDLKLLNEGVYLKQQIDWFYNVLVPYQNELIENTPDLTARAVC